LDIWESSLTDIWGESPQRAPEYDEQPPHDVLAAGDGGSATGAADDDDIDAATARTDASPANLPGVA